MIVLALNNQKGVETKPAMRMIKRQAESNSMPGFYIMYAKARQLSNCFGIGCRLMKSDRKEDSHEKAKRSVYDPDGCAGARIYAEHHGRLCQCQ
jgi:hypothetical protein